MTSTLWNASAWFRADADAFDAVEANANATTTTTSNAKDDDEKRCEGPKRGAIGGAFCQNRFTSERGARDPFAPASAMTESCGKAKGDGESDGGAEGWSVRAWNAPRRERGKNDGGRDRKAGERSYRAFERGRARRMTEERGGEFAFDFDAKRWSVVRDGASAALEIEFKTLEADDGAIAVVGVDVAVDGGDGDGEGDGDARSDDSMDVHARADDEGRTMREKARRERLRRYQPSYDASSASASERERARRDRVAENVDFTRERVGDAATRGDVDAATRGDVDSATRHIGDSPSSFDSGLPAIDAHWVPFACSNGSTVWIELASDVDAATALPLWVAGDAPWPIIRRLDLGRDRSGIPRNAPGREIDDPVVRAMFESELRARALEAAANDASRSVAPPTTSDVRAPRARAVNPADGTNEAHANIINAVMNAAAPQADGTLSRNEKVLQSALADAVREKHLLGAEVARLRRIIADAGLTADGALA